MSSDPADPGEPADVRAATDAYDRIVAELAGEPGVDMGRIFHSEGLNLGGRYFALLTGAELVLKLPAGRVTELAASGRGRPFEPRPGRLMREWVSLDRGDMVRWPALAREALDFGRQLAAAPAPRRRRR
jgi:hypothetical protein